MLINIDNKVPFGLVERMKQNGDLLKNIRYEHADQLKSFVRDRLEIKESEQKNPLKPIEFHSNLIIITNTETIQAIADIIKGVDMMNPKQAEALRKLIFEQI